jgi:hypothetical protein
MRQCASAVTSLADKVLLPVEELIDAVGERRYLNGKASCHAPGSTGLNGIQFMSDGAQWAQPQGELKPCEENENHGNGDENAGYVPSERLAQRNNLSVIKGD